MVNLALHFINVCVPANTGNLHYYITLLANNTFAIRVTRNLMLDVENNPTILFFYSLTYNLLDNKIHSNQ